MFTPMIDETYLLSADNNSGLTNKLSRVCGNMIHGSSLEPGVIYAVRDGALLKYFLTQGNV